MKHRGKLPDSPRSCLAQVIFHGKTSSMQALGLWASLQEQCGTPAGTKAGVWLPEASLPLGSVCGMCRGASHLRGAAISERGCNRIYLVIYMGREERVSVELDNIQNRDCLSKTH